jgi:uroporphyrinogen-III synthase
MRVLVTRPEPEALRLKAALERRDIEVTVEPLLHVSFEDADPIDLMDVQALIATSRNGLRALKLAGHLDAARSLPVFTVGSGTAAEARALGFQVVVAGAGGASALVPQIASALDPTAGLVLHLAGDRLAGDLRGELEQQGFRVLQPVVYHTVPATAFGEDTVEQLALGEIEGVLLMSPRTAVVYMDLVRKHGLSTAVRELIYYCLSQAVADRLASLDASHIRVPDRPSLEEVLALVVSDAAQLDM